MKKLLLSLVILSTTTHLSQAQINLIGAVSNAGTGLVEIVTWDAFDTDSPLYYETPLTGYYLTSSVYDSYNGNYYITGITENSSGLLSFNTKTLEQDLSPFNNFTNITEIDMATGKIYNLTMDSLEYFSVNEYDIETGTDSLLGVIYEPGTNGIIVDAIAFNSNDGILYYLGYDTMPSLVLYSIPVREDEFSYTKTTVVTNNIADNFFSLNFDNVNNTIFALQSVYDSNYNIAGTNLSEIDPLTGDVTVRDELEEFMGFVIGSSAFDQNSGSYIVIGIDTSYIGKLIVFDTYTNTYTIGWAPDGVSEIVCDNTVFALNNYIITRVDEQQKADVKIFPNPAFDRVTVTIPGSFGPDATLDLFDLTGKWLLNEAFREVVSLEVDVTGLKTGIYLLKISTGSTVETHKLVVR